MPFIPFAVFGLLSYFQPHRAPAPEGPAHVQAEPSVSLDEAVRVAVTNNPRLTAAARDILAAERGVSGARALANPDVLITPGLPRVGSDEELLIRQPLEINGTRSARAAVASARLRAVRAEALIELRDVVYQTKAAYLELARAQERRSLAHDLLKNAQELDQNAQRQVELGSRPGVERTQTGIEVTRARQQATLAEADYTAALSQLNTQLGRTPGTTLALPPLVFTSQPVDEAEAVRQALSARAELSLTEANRDAFRQEARLAKAEGRIDIAPQVRAESFTREPREIGVGLGLSIPIFDHGSRRNRVRQAEESAKAQEQRLLAGQNQARLDVAQSVARLRATEAVIGDYQSGLLEETRKLLEARRTGFRLGQTDIVSLLEAQRTYRAVQAEYIDALASHALAKAQLERATGAVPESLLPTLPIQEGKIR